MDKLKEVDWRGLYKTATNKVKKYTLNLTDLEIKVEEATSAETWGPHGSVMNEIADAAFDPENYRQIMGVLARRLQERDENWRMCYKALLLLEHLIKHGPGKVIGDVQSSAAVLDRLQHFEYKDPNMRDHGVNVRHRAKEILQLVNSPERLREEREKAKSNRSKYRGVSADQMRSSSFARAASDHYSSSTSGSLYPGGGGGGGGGGLGGGSSLGGGGLGGAGSGYAGVNRRTDSYDETDEGAHYISKRGGGGGGGGLLDAGAGSSSSAAAGGGDGGGGGGGGGGGEDALAATRARIDRLKLEDKAPPADEKKRLTDVRVNPKIAASLGLAIPAAAPPRPAAAAVAAAPAAPAAGPAPAGAMDLLGGLEEPQAAAAAPPPPAPPAPPAAASFDPFGAAAPGPPPAAAAPQQGWDAFGGAASAAPALAAAPAAPLDMLGGLDFAAPAAFHQPPAFHQPLAAAPAPADPFAAFTASPPATAAPVPFVAARPAAAAPPAPLPTVAAGVPAALPEDMFADLTGIGGRQHQPMGLSPHTGPSPPAPSPPGMGAAGAGMGWGMPAASPPSPGGGFGSFSGGAMPAAAMPVAGAGTGLTPPGAGFGAAPGTGAHSRSGSMGGPVDLGSLSYSSPAQGGASAADPFADLMK